MAAQKRALVTGAGGFIGHHLAKRLVQLGYHVCGADLKHPEFEPTAAQEFVIADLRSESACKELFKRPFDEVYQLAADMGGMGFISTAECPILHNNALININVLEAALRAGVKRYFFSSSVCVYRNMRPGEPALTEEDAYPAMPDNEYGWEKLYAERMALAYARNNPGFETRIARFQNCYGPLGTWTGGREKAPAAFCRKVALAPDGGEIEVWGDGTAVRNFIYVDDLVDGIIRLVQSDERRPTNIGTDEYVTVDELARTVISVSGKRLSLRHVPGPVGVQSRNFSNARIRALGWAPRHSLLDGIRKTYPWVAEQVRKAGMRA